MDSVLGDTDDPRKDLYFLRSEHLETEKKHSGEREGNT